FDTESTAYNIPMALRLTGDLDVTALEQALADVIARHETLRTIYPEFDDGAVQKILAPEQARVELPVEKVNEAQLPEALLELATTRFDVTTEVPIRARLLRVISETGDARTHILGVVMHHISADGSSLAPLARDLVLAYSARAAGIEPDQPALEVQYADYALWQRDVLGSPDNPQSTAAAQIAYWKQRLAGAPDQIELPADRPRPAVQSFRGGRVHTRVDADTHARLAALARGHSATLFMAVHAVYATLLARLTGTGDVVIGSPIAGRGERALEDVVGMFVNTLALRTELDPAMPFERVLDLAREVDLAAFDHAAVPFEQLVEAIDPVRSTARHPIFQVGYTLQNQQQASVELPGLEVSTFEVDANLSQFDLHLIGTDRYVDGVPDGIDITFTYAQDLFDPITAQSFADRFQQLLGEVLDRPTTPIGDVDLLGVGERQVLLDEWSSASAPIGPDGRSAIDGRALPIGLVLEQAALHPDAIALRTADRALTYREMIDDVEDVARGLVAAGARPEQRIALAMRRSIDLVIGMYAISRAGAVYVPVDPTQPAERVAAILGAAQPMAILTDADSADRLGTAPPTDAPVLRIEALRGSAPTAELPSKLRPASAMYVIFTSGSTGLPKGVVLTHGAVANQLQWKRSWFGLGPDDAALLKTAATFDLSVWEFWSLTTAGGTIVIAGPDDHRDPARLLELIVDGGVTTLHLVPTMLEALLVEGDGALPGGLRRILAIGEELPAATAQRALGTGVELYNLYGPTEAAVSVTAHRVDASERSTVPIGGPEWNTRVLVLDDRLHLAPVGVVGELYLAGVQLARGYHGRPDATAERFVADPFGPPGSVLYRTGDLARRNDRGELIFLGRVDFQVKVRGFRIELGDIEHALRSIDTVATATAALWQDERTGDRLVGYVTPAAGATVDVEDIERRLAEALPSYMVPSAIVVLDVLPMNVNGKVDRNALPAPALTAGDFVPPATPIEQLVAAVYEDVLGIERVGAGDDFFRIGGNSLAATRAVARIGAALGSRVPVRLIFEAPTVTALARRVESAADGDLARIPLVAGPRPDRIPLSLAQQRMWVLNRVDPGSAAYNIPVAIRLSGLLDVPAMRDAVRDVIARHEVLRTRYPEDADGPYQLIEPVAAVDTTLTLDQVTEADLPAAVIALVTEGFDVTEQVPLRMRLFELSPTEYVLVVVLHHIAGDGYSLGPMVRDVMTAYSARLDGELPGWAPPAAQYADYAMWQRQVLGEETDATSVVSAQLRYWADQLAGAPDLLELPTDRPRPARQSMRGDSIDFTVDAELVARVETLARERGSTVFMVVHAALAIVLGTLGRTDDISIGTPVAGRGEEALDDMIGMFVNTLVLRTRIDPAATFADVLTSAREVDLGAFANADIPFERIVEELGHARSSAYSPLYQVMLTFQNAPKVHMALPGLEISAFDSDIQQTKADLQVAFDGSAAGTGEGMRAMISYATDLFDRSTMLAFAERLVSVLERVTSDPEVEVRDIDVLTEAERRELAPSFGVEDLPQLVAAAAQSDPDATAIEHDGRVVTYRQLHERLELVGALAPAARVPVALNGLLPGMLASLGADGYAAALQALVADAARGGARF
uniref:non-ribosomal peptide synthetase n=1 Tax=Millisia brevis TaxID=264148 RepID=UPI000B2C1F0F